MANVTEDQKPLSFMEELKKAQKEEKPKSLLWLVFLLFSLFGLGIYDFLAGNGENHCAMTYMYEYPLYLDFKLMGNDLDKKFPNYKLVAYGEGEDYVRRLSHGDFDGIPVLFIPGNAGSNKQVRSMASVALRKAYEEDIGLKFHFNYFALDFNEEFSALYGGTLDDQAEYAAEAINAILTMYNEQSRQTKKAPPKSVILIGHSIGGMIARAVFLQPGFNPKRVNTLITLATPHKPVVVMDHETKTFYDKVNQYWNETRSTSLSSLTFVSVAGGDRDFQVRSGLAQSEHADVNVASTHSPGIWVSADHLCVAWCKQLVIALNRALFDAVDRKTMQITQRKGLRRDIFEYHLLHKIGGKEYRPLDSYPKELEFDKDGFWTDSMKRQFVFMRDAVSDHSYIMIKVLDDPKHEVVTIDALNLQNHNWLFGCKATTIYNNIRLCTKGDNLSTNFTQLLPSSKLNRKMVQINLHQLAKKHGYTHVVVFVPKKSEKIKVSVDVYNPKDRFVESEVPRWISFWKRHEVVPQTAPTSVFYNVSLLSMTSPWQAYDIHVTPINKCDDQSHYGLLRFVTPWSFDTTQDLVGFNVSNKLTAKLQSPKPGDETRHPQMHIFLNPSCQYKIEIQSNIAAMWGQMVRYYGTFILPMSVAVLMLALAQQIRGINEDQTCPTLLSVLSSKVTPISVVMPGRLLTAVFSSAMLAHIIPRNDFQKLADQGLDFAVLPIVMFFVTIGVVTILAAAAWISVMVVGTLANKVVTKILTRAAGGNDVVADVALAGLSRFPLILSGLLMALATATCGTLALCLGTLCHFLQLFYLYEDYLRSLAKSAVGIEPRKVENLRSANFQLTMLLLWVIATVLNLPSLVAWTKNLDLTNKLNPDPSLFPAIVMCVCMAATWGDRAPRPNLKFYDKIANAIQLLCILTVLYGLLNIYMVNYFLSTAMVMVAAHQLLAPGFTPEELAARQAEREKAKQKVDTNQEKEASEADQQQDNESGSESNGSDED